MAQVEMDGIRIGEVETKNIMTKSSLPVGGCGLHPCLQILLCFFHEAFYGSHGEMGNIS